MTRTNTTKTSKSKIILTLLIVCVLCFSLFFVACASEKPKTNDSSLTYTETDNSLGELANTSFVYGTTNAKFNSYPRTSVNGWSLTKNSSAKSGVVNTNDDAWKELMISFYGDAGIMDYVKTKEGLYGANYQTEIKERVQQHLNITEDPTEAQIKAYYAEVLMPKYFENPSIHTQDIDQKIYMLNNYKTGEAGSGSAQILSSTTDVVLEKGAYAKVSVWVMTDNLAQFSTQTVGANITINASFNQVSQTPYGFFNIDTQGQWKNYTFYVKADEVFETKFSLVLGLGYNNDYSEGTAYFDDIVVELLDKDTFDASVIDANAVTTFKLNDQEDFYKAITPVANKYACLNLTFDHTAITANNGSAKYFNTLNFANNSFTTSANLTGEKFPSLSKATFPDATSSELKGSGATSGKKAHVEYASYTIELAEFSIPSESYAYVYFYIKSDLIDMYSTNVTINVYDIYKTDSELRPKIAELTTADGEWINCSILVKNNFNRDIYSDLRTFRIEIVIGPEDLKLSNLADYAFGDVYITTPMVATGATYKYASEYDTENDIKTENYDFYQFFSSAKKGSLSLYAGYDEEDTKNESVESYSFNVSKSDVGTISSRPATPANYKGVVADHYYVKEGSQNYEIDANQNAGLINTKYLTSSFPNGANIKSKLGWNDGDANIQPLMIYNDSLTSYGYLSSSYILSANSEAKVSLKVRVTDSATAYIYIVDASQATKNVMTFADFKVNATTISKALANGTQVNAEDYKLQLAITSSMMDADGWATVSFHIASGITPKTFRVEMWNGGRDGSNQTASSGYVFFNNVEVATVNGFKEPAKWQSAFTVAQNPLYDAGEEDVKELIAYKQVLNDKEMQYNNDPSKTDITYPVKYVWAKTDTMIYAIYNTVDPEVVDPYANENNNNDNTTEEDNDTVPDPASFWMQLSSILLVIALVAAIVALFVKNYLRRRKANANDAKSHYQVVSRVNKKQPAKKTEIKREEVKEEVFEDEIVEDEVVENEQLDQEQSLDEFVYGEVQSFDDDIEDKNE